jgi:hypothetical protein
MIIKTYVKFRDQLKGVHCHFSNPPIDRPTQTNQVVVGRCSQLRSTFTLHMHRQAVRGYSRIELQEILATYISLSAPLKSLKAVQVQRQGRRFLYRQWMVSLLFVVVDCCVGVLRLHLHLPTDYRHWR